MANRSHSSRTSPSVLTLATVVLVSASCGGARTTTVRVARFTPPQTPPVQSGDYGANRATVNGSHTQNSAGSLVASSSGCSSPYSLYNNTNTTHPPAFYTFAVPQLGCEYGLVTIAFFISAANIGPLGVGIGDDRGFAAGGMPSPSAARVAFTLNFATGQGVMRINPTCASGVLGCGGPNPIVPVDTGTTGLPIPFGEATLSATNLIETHKTTDGVLIQLAAANGAAAPWGAWLLGEIDATMAIKAESAGNLKAVFTLKGFPSTEAYQIANGTVRALIQKREQGWSPSDPIDMHPDDSSLLTPDSTTTTVCTWDSTCASPAPCADTLFAGHSLGANQSLKSCNGQYTAIMQRDGNFVVYAPQSQPLWSTRTTTPGSALAFQTDGNLVVYSPASPPHALWASRTPCAATRLVMQNDNNLVIYNGNSALWSWKTGPIPSGCPPPPAPGDRWDGQDPYATGCASGSYVVQSATRNIIDTESGSVVGRIEIHWSPTCQTNWGEAFWSASDAGSLNVTITVVRVSDGLRESYHFNGSGSHVWGNMVYSPGCAYATVSRTVGTNYLEYGTTGQAC